jgi:hypothetical protein
MLGGLWDLLGGLASRFYWWACQERSLVSMPARNQITVRRDKEGGDFSLGYMVST